MKQLLGLILLIFSANLSAQGVKINHGTPSPADSSAILELESTQKGFLLPRLSTAQRNAIASPAVGLQIYNTSTRCVETFFPVGWRPTGCQCTVFPNAGFTLQPTFPSAGFPIQFMANDSSNALSWTFQNGSPANDTVGAPIVTFSNPDTVSVVLRATDSQGCQDSTTQTIIIQNCPLNTPNPAFTASPASPGTNQAVTFNPSSLVGVSHSWSFASGNPGSSSATNPTSTWSSAGTYSVIHQVTDSSTGCVQADTLALVVSACITGGNANFIFTGNLQLWTAPAGVCTIQVEGWGARGGDGGGYGAYVVGTFSITPGQQYKILVGRKGNNGNGGGGGGGTWFTDANNNPLLVAGGGGGKGYGNSNLPSSVNGGACGGSGCSGTQGSCGSPGTGGSNGAGGLGATCTQNGTGGGGGAGTLTGGGTANGCSYSQSTGGAAFVNGGAGGLGGCGVAGGFGGGGGGGCNGGGGGGGGGYSGGGGGNPWCNNGGIGGHGGGGGCYNTGTNTSLTVGGNLNDDGRLYITW
jgi:hypothetical protein